jgi:hypothetical protein
MTILKNGHEFGESNSLPLLLCLTILIILCFGKFPSLLPSYVPDLLAGTGTFEDDV